jgi:hypothetical protein
VSGRTFLRWGLLALSVVLPICGPAASAALAAPPPNDDYNSATALPTAKFAQAPGTTVEATDGNFDGDLDVWYTWTAPSSGPVEIVLTSSTRAPEFALFLDGTEADFQDLALDSPPDFPIINDCNDTSKTYCNDYRVQAGQTYRIRAFTCVNCGYPETAFSLRVLQDDVGPETRLARYRVLPFDGVVGLFPRAADPAPSVGGVEVQCKVGNHRFRRCDKRSQTRSWRLFLHPPLRTGTHTKRWLAQLRGVDANGNVDLTPLRLRVSIKQRCGPSGLGSCTILRVRVRRA